MAHRDCKLFTATNVKLIKIRCRKLGVRADRADDYLQDLALKALQSNCKKATLNCRSIDNHITSQLRKEIRYQKLLIELTESFQEAVSYPLHLQIDIQSLMSSLSLIQQEICKLISIGFTHKEISKELKISPRTIGREISLIKRHFNDSYS